MCNVLVRGFNYDIQQEDLVAHCSTVGRVVDISFKKKGSGAPGAFGKGGAAEAFGKSGAFSKGCAFDQGPAVYNRFNEANGKGGKGGKMEWNAVARPQKPEPQAQQPSARALLYAGCIVAVHGFDFGTTLRQVEGHFAEVGEVVHGKLRGKGEALVTFRSPEVAQEAIQRCNGTTIAGNQRPIEVRLKGEPRSGVIAAAPPVARPVAAKRKLSVVSGVFAQRDAKRRTRKGRCEKPPWAHGMNGRRVFIRGFDFDTPEDQVRAHCERVGVVKNFSLVSKGAALAEYETELEALEAIATLTGTIIDGNTRPLDVMIDGDGENAALSQGLFDEANAEWHAALEHAWELFSIAQPTRRTLGVFLEEAKRMLKVRAAQ